MGKNKKKQEVEPINLNSGPLKSVTIAEINEKKHSWVGILLLFILFIGIVFFLPDINKLYQKLVGSSSTVPTGKKADDTPNTDDSEEDEVEETKYLFGEVSSTQFGELSFSNISYTDGSLSFTVTNNSDKSIEMQKENAYFVTYDQSGKILNSIALKDVIEAGQSKEYSYQIESGAPSFNVKEILPEDYTYIDLNVDENGVSILTCEKDREKFVYTFTNELLTKIEHTKDYSIINNDYDLIYDTYNGLRQDLSSKTGITSSLNHNSEGFSFNSTINYTEYEGELEFEYYFKKGEEPRIVNFIMESNLFSCA